MTPRAYPPQRGTRTAIVTGGSTGIGLAAAVSLAQEGWNVTISGRRQEQLETASQAIFRSTGDDNTQDNVSVFAGDMTCEDDVQQMFRQTQAKWGQVDLVFINAGKSSPAIPIQASSLSEWQSVVDVNLTAAYLCAREAFRYMDGSRGVTGGRIILNGSISAHTPRPMSAAYTATKHAISGLSKALALDGRMYIDIAVSQIDIGNVASQMTQSMGEGPGVLQADGTYEREPTFDVEFAAREVVHLASLPLSVNIQNVLIMATNMPSHIGRG
ncbi:hypothetical protein CBS101457_000016 [Exobasidium rhododendri]|nr:hypothetical protein CBS101457_000016 [Exobasidium rhododendri]